MEQLNVLIFSASFGAGHVRAAEAIIEALRAKDPNVKITHLDFGAFLSKTFNSVVKNTYIELIKHTPRLWGKFYYRTSKIPPDSLFQRFLNGLGRREFVRFIQVLQPDLVICTYPTVAGVLAQQRLRGVLNVPLVTVVTDYAVHSQWIHPGVDHYIVGCEDVYKGLVARGINPQTIHISGIPVSPKFELKLDRRMILQNLTMNPELPTVLVMGGAYGVLGGAKWICKTLSEAAISLQTIVVCGQDEKLYKALDSLVEDCKNPLVRFGFVNNVEELMSAADIIITKAGGLTVSEALTKRLPLVIFKPIPGQEEENARYLEKIGAGRAADNEEGLEKIIFSLLQHPEAVEQMCRAAAQAVPGRAAERAVEGILRLVEERRSAQRIG
ncbi:processive diacylglycerol beta-glucosyltransferase [Desulfosporosinus acididurans]|uniref:Processive diacylglycerol beta-glucosyltransferase n=1 Tax=Desulfosporosinus acididurans TaxID=476652 RepID=A0A0J1FL97_9FIRM|nr:UDP-N-acetylglucosamine--LPS N-acetylglucosamine transferase [Desulfosporosinus acididurans]KLU64294.1 processive diacylglycerol beta-glucosyltransferase [Desulfosporosinus acididurans]